MTTLMRFAIGNAHLGSHLGFNVHLTQRQREVLLLLCEGLPNKLIGRRLAISDNTVKSHVASVLRSLNAATRLEAVTVAFKLGLVQPSELQQVNVVAPGRATVGAAGATPRIAIAA